MSWRKFVPIAFILFVLSGLSIVPAAAQSGVIWTAEYFNNPYLIAPASIIRQEGGISFNWGAGSPGAGINADNFSARWGTDAFFNAGSYRFYIQADDYVHVYIDFQPLIDTFGQNKVGQIVTQDINLAQGTHHIQVDYQEVGGNAYAFFTWANLATNPGGPNFPVPNNPGGQVIPASGPWTAQYFANPTLSGTPSLIQSEVSPTHNWGSGSPVASIPADNFSARWTTLQFTEAGTYLISVQADDGVRVVIDGIVYIDRFNFATGQTYTATANLYRGNHNFVVEYFEGGGVAYLNYSFNGGSIPPTPVIYPTPVVTGAAATVTNAYRLNVRNIPNPIIGTVLTKISRFETYPVVGRNSNRSWWQLNVNGIIGWVNGRYITVVNAQNVPVTDGTVVTPPPVNCNSAPTPRLIVGRLGRVTPGYPNNIRLQPSSSSALVGQMPAGAVFSVLGGPQCSQGWYWWQVNYYGVVGWTPEGGSGQYWLEPVY
jgi:hypothetical protein